SGSGEPRAPSIAVPPEVPHDEAWEHQDMRGAATSRTLRLPIAMLGVGFMVAAGCGSGSTPTNRASTAGHFERLRPVSSDSPCCHLTPTDEDEARQIIATDPAFQPLAQAGRGYSIGEMGPIQA